MNMEITIDGETYKSRPTNEASVIEVAETIFKELDEMVKMKFELENGGILLLGKDAVQRMQLVIYP